jgi:hypothetical protein
MYPTIKGYLWEFVVLRISSGALSSPKNPKTFLGIKTFRILQFDTHQIKGNV